MRNVFFQNPSTFYKNHFFSTIDEHFKHYWTFFKPMNVFKIWELLFKICELFFKSASFILNSWTFFFWNSRFFPSFIGEFFPHLRTFFNIWTFYKTHELFYKFVIFCAKSMNYFHTHDLVSKPVMSFKIREFFYNMWTFLQVQQLFLKSQTFFQNPLTYF